MKAKFEYKKSYCQRLIDHMAKGLSFISFAGEVGVTKSILNDWLIEYPDFKEAKEIGEMKSLLKWEKIGISGTTGALKGFSAKTWQLQMTNYFAESWQEKKKIEHSGPEGEQLKIQFIIPDNGRGDNPFVNSDNLKDN
ncbi:MAG: hypothetical protein ABFD50_08210 [Smithella sp.]